MHHPSFIGLLGLHHSGYHNPRSCLTCRESRTGTMPKKPHVMSACEVCAMTYSRSADESPCRCAAAHACGHTGAAAGGQSKIKASVGAALFNDFGDRIWPYVWLRPAGHVQEHEGLAADVLQHGCVAFVPYLIIVLHDQLHNRSITSRQRGTSEQSAPAALAKGWYSLSWTWPQHLFSAAAVVYVS